MFDKIRRFLSLSRSDRAIFLKAYVLLPAAAIRVQVTSLKGTLAWLTRRASQKTGIVLADESKHRQAQDTARLVKRAIFYSPIKGKCLSQSLVLWHLLVRQGIQSDLRIGVYKKDDQLPFTPDNFEAHAWVEYQGEVLNDAPDVHERFVAIQTPIQRYTGKGSEQL